MLDILFYIPSNLFGWPMFGIGILLFVWAAASGGLLTYLVRKQGWNADTRGYVPVLLLIGAVICFLLNLLIEARGLPIRGYGTMVLLGVASGIWLAAVRGKRAGLNVELIFSLALWLFVAGMVGGRTFYVIEYWKKQFVKPTIGETIAAVANISQGGLVVFGAFIGATTAFIIFARMNRLPVLGTFDLIAPSMVLGLAIGRLGCFLHGCCYGGTCSLPWAVTFPYNSPPHLKQATDGLTDLHGIKLRIEKDASGELLFSGPPVIASVEPNSDAEKAGLKNDDVLLEIDTQDPTEKTISSRSMIANVGDAQSALLRITSPGTLITVHSKRQPEPISWTVPAPLARSKPVHPVQIYAALDALILCLFLLAWYPYRRWDGELLAWMLSLHAISRYLQEVLRTDEGGVFGTGLSISQNISIAMFVVGLGLWCYLWKYGERRLNFYRPSGI